MVERPGSQPGGRSTNCWPAGGLDGYRSWVDAGEDWSTSGRNPSIEQPGRAFSGCSHTAAAPSACRCSASAEDVFHPGEENPSVFVEHHLSFRCSNRGTPAPSPAGQWSRLRLGWVTRAHVPPGTGSPSGLRCGNSGWERSIGSRRLSLQYTGCSAKKKNCTQAAAYKWEKGEHMENRILAQLDGRADRVAAHPAQRAAAHLHPGGVERGTIPSGRRRIFCPSYRRYPTITPAGFRVQ